MNTAVFTVTNAVLFKGFRGIAHNERLVYIGTQRNGLGCCASFPDFVECRAQAHSFSDMAAVADAVLDRTLKINGTPVRASEGRDHRAELRALADWLVEREVEEVVMESTANRASPPRTNCSLEQCARGAQRRVTSCQNGVAMKFVFTIASAVFLG
jgi:hypothetical protein